MTVPSAQETQDFYDREIEWARPYFIANDEAWLRAGQLQDNDAAQPIRLFLDSHQLFEEYFPTVEDPDPNAYDERGVTAADENGLRGLFGLQEYRVFRLRHALQSGNATARKVCEDWEKARFMWHDEQDEYFVGRMEEIFMWCFDKHAMVNAWWKQDYEFAVLMPNFADGEPISYDGWVNTTAATGVANIPGGYVLIDSLDEELGSRGIRQDKITPAQAVIIAMEALDVALADAGLPGWDEFGGND